MNQRQQAWTKAAQQEAARGNDVAVGLFMLIAQPNQSEREHNCNEHSVGFRRNGRRGFKCGIDGKVLRWIDA